MAVAGSQERTRIVPGHAAKEKRAPARCTFPFHTKPTAAICRKPGMSITIAWFRQDLRLSDNPALIAAARTGQVLPIYILDDHHAGEWRAGAASRWWLHRSLAALNESLQGRLRIFAGDPEVVLPRLASEIGAAAIHWNRCYEPWRTRRDQRLKATLRAAGVEVVSHQASLLWEPWSIHKSDGTPYKVFTPFYRHGCLPQGEPRMPLPPPPSLQLFSGDPQGVPLEQLALMPAIPWYREMEALWPVGERGAESTLAGFLAAGLNDYREGRDFPALKAVSRLSPYLHHGEISPFRVWAAATQSLTNGAPTAAVEHFQRELGWREFSHHLLYHFPDLPSQNLQRQFDHFPWRQDGEALKRWQRGWTGYPLVDAGMRELWRTGYMHNRVRMITASFLVKNLMLDWRLGQAWFWDCLVDADLANNSASWQWVAGSGADAAPYFRIFNPVTQSQKFDPDGAYLRTYLPELAALPTRYLHDPSNAPDDVLRAAGIELDRDYPRAMVPLADSRAAALAAYHSLRAAS